VAGIPDQIRIVYKKELERIPLFGWGLKWGSYIGIDRSNRADAMKSIEEAAAKIHRGASVLLYAEGTRTLDGKLQPFKRGAFNLAVKSGVPVVPLTINGTFTILPKRSVSVAPGPVELVLDSPIPVDSEGGKEEEFRVMTLVQQAIARYYREQ
jgi:1-acyl-sn-glycerol-3-phosphate acyltransferase